MFGVIKPGVISTEIEIKYNSLYPHMHIEICNKGVTVSSIDFNFEECLGVSFIYFDGSDLFLRPVEHVEEWEFFEEGNDVAKAEWSEFTTIGYLVNFAYAKLISFRYTPTVIPGCDVYLRPSKENETVHDVIRNRIGTRWALFGDVYADQIPFFDLYSIQRLCRERNVTVKAGVFKFVVTTENELLDTTEPWPEVAYPVDRPMITIENKCVLWDNRDGSEVPLAFTNGCLAECTLTPGVYDLYWSDYSDPEGLVHVPQRRISIYPTPLRIYVV